MKKTLLLICVLISSAICAQQSKLPKLNLKNLEGKTIDVSKYNSSKNPVIVSFWATWCGPCVNELSAIHQVYEKWQKDLGVELVAVSIDDARTKKRVKPMVNGKGWEYEIVLDENHDLKRALNIVNVPYTFVIYDGEVIFEHSGYTPGSENTMYNKIKSKLK